MSRKGPRARKNVPYLLALSGDEGRRAPATGPSDDAYVDDDYMGSRHQERKPKRSTTPTK